jgi:hypothetical protein
MQQPILEVCERERMGARDALAPATCRDRRKIAQQGERFLVPRHLTGRRNGRRYASPNLCHAA